MRRLTVCLSLVISAMCFVAPHSIAADSESPIGKKIDEFSLHDFRGKVHNLSDYKDSKAIVVAFIGIECPLAKLYVGRLEQMAADFGDKGVAVLAIDSNRQDSITELTGFAARYKLTFPILKDPDNKVADLFDAKRTPEAYLLDSNGVVQYYGRIDDQYGQHLGENGKRISYQHTHPRRNDLVIAIEETLAGKEITEPLTEAVGCLIGRVPKVTPGGEITFTKHISRILNNRCVECHREGEVAPMTLTDYDEVVGWSEMIREVVAEERMPPFHANPEYGDFENDCRLTGEEKEQIFTWVDNGSPEGDPADLPEPPKFVDGWEAGEPDQIIYMSDEPYEVAAEGTVEYQYFAVDPGWKEDKWIKVAEARPGNRAVVHHILCSIRTDAGGAATNIMNGVGIGWAPGLGPRNFKGDMALHIPAGADRISNALHAKRNQAVGSQLRWLPILFTRRGQAFGLRRSCRCSWFQNSGRRRESSSRTRSSNSIVTSCYCRCCPTCTCEANHSASPPRIPMGKRRFCWTFLATTSTGNCAIT